MTPAEQLQRLEAKAKRERWEDALYQQMRAAKLAPLRQYKMDGLRFVWDFAFPSHRLLIEVHGGIWLAKGAHNTGEAITRDCAKLSVAVSQGWRQMAVVPEQIQSGQALVWVRSALEAWC